MDALGVEAPKPGSLALGEIKVYTHSVDEWYGVEINFKWKGEVPAEQVEALEENPAQALDVISKAINTPEYQEFFSVPRRVACEEYDGGPERVVTLPKFKAGDFTDWSFNAQGGWLCAAERD